MRDALRHSRFVGVVMIMDASGEMARRSARDQDSHQMAALTTPNEEMVSKAGLKARGWTEAGIRSFLGEPDATRPNPKYASAAPMSLYELPRVKRVERTRTYRAWQAKSEKRKDSALDGVTTKKAKLRTAIEGRRPKIPVLPFEELRRRAVANHNNHREERDVWSGGAIEWTPGMEATDAGFLDRITVNYLRHVHTNYDGLLESLHGKIGIAEARGLVRELVYQAIADAYPDLGSECRRQEEARVWAEEGRLDALASRSR